MLSDELNNVPCSAVWARFAPTVSAESREKGWPVPSVHPPRFFAAYLRPATQDDGEKSHSEEAKLFLPLSFRGGDAFPPFVIPRR